MAPKSDTMMTLAIHDQRLAKPGLQNAALRDYDSVRRAIAFISEHWRTQPTIEAMADAAAVTPDELHHLFRRWAGLTPKAFMQALTLDHAKNLLRDSASVLDAALDSGLSGPGRLHDLFVTHEAMSPGEWKTGGGGMTLRYGFHPSPFGTAIVIATDRGLAGLAFADPGDEQTAFADMKRRWPNATYVEDTDGTTALAQRVFDTRLWRADQPLRVVLIGTDFEVRVWETLLKIPMGRAVSYSDIACNINSPKASRAVGAAVGDLQQAARVLGVALQPHGAGPHQGDVGDRGVGLEYALQLAEQGGVAGLGAQAGLGLGGTVPRPGQGGRVFGSLQPLEVIGEGGRGGETGGGGGDERAPPDGATGHDRPSNAVVGRRDAPVSRRGRPWRAAGR